MVTAEREIGFLSHSGIPPSPICSFVSEENRNHVDGMSCKDRLKDDSISPRYLAVEALEQLSLERLHEAAERVLRKLADVVQNALAAVGRYRVKLFCGVAVDVLCAKSCSKSVNVTYLPSRISCRAFTI
jgi:hypothetical protein